MTSGTRYAYLDNIKILLVCGVIAMHVSITYGFDGSWYLESYGQMSDFTIKALTLVMGAGWLFGLGLFFLIAGRLTGPSLDHKGAARFVRERLIRIGTPIVVYMFTVSPVLEYVAFRENEGGTMDIWPFVSEQVWRLAPGPTWFLEALLLFSLGYAGLFTLEARHSGKRSSPRKGRHERGQQRGRTPANGDAPLRGSMIAATAGAIAFCSFCAHLAFPIGEEQFHVQLGMFPQYIAMFALGVAAGRRGWLETISPRMQWRCGAAGVAGILVFAASITLGGFFDSDKKAELFAGGLHWQASLASLTEGVIAVCISLWAVSHFRRRYNTLRPLAARMAPSAYGAFVLHPPVIVGLAFALAPLPGPDEIKFVTLLTTGIAGAFALASILSRWTPAARVIGASTTVRVGPG
ncbi:MAG: acyltransferase [Actinobacteria bacterium]|nr:acyltransferase [Actinomycetota bacterium]